MAALKKSIYSLSDVVEILAAACARYLDFIGTLEDDTAQRHDLDADHSFAHGCASR